MDEIIVAKKAKLLAAYIMFIILGVASAVLGIVLGLKQEQNRWLMIGVFGLMGVAFIAVGIWQIIKYAKTPAIFITYKDGLFTFADGTTCNPNEITHVMVKLTRQNGVVNSTGGLVITVNGSRTIEYQNVAYVQQAQTEIQLITDEYNARLYREAQAAQAQQNNSPADPFADIQSASTVGAVEPVAPVSSAQTVQAEEQASNAIPTDGDGKSEN